VGKKEVKTKKDAENMFDLALVHRFKAGEEQVFFELVNKYKASVAGIIYRFIGVREEVEDVSQEVFFQLYRSLASFKGRSRFFTWFYRLVFNVCMQHKRGKASEINLVSFEKTETVLSLPKNTSQPEKILEEKYLREKINTTLEKLPLELRIAFILREIQDLSYAEIAVITGVPRGTVKSRIHAARARIAKELIFEGEK